MGLLETATELHLQLASLTEHTVQDIQEIETKQ